MLLPTGLIASVTILVSAYWFTNSLNSVAREGSTSIVSLLVEETVGHLQSSVEEYAFWDLAHEIVRKDDKDRIHEHLGSGAWESELFDQLLILSSQFEILHSFQSEGEVELFRSSEGSGLESFYSRLMTGMPGDFESATGFVNLGGRYAAVSATRITPDYFPEIENDDFNFLAGVRLLDADWFERISRYSGQIEHAIVPPDLVPENSDRFVLLLGPNSESIAALIWTGEEIGSKLWEEALPVLSLICTGIMIVCLAAARFVALQNKSLRKLGKIASTDQLTGALNRAGLDQVVTDEETRSLIASGQAAVIYLDLDDLKQLNDELGHVAGDIALKITADRLSKSTRRGDFVCRYGGDEFVCLVFDADVRRAAAAVVERFKKIMSVPIDFADTTQKISASMGVATSSEGQTWEMLIAQADKAMYDDKRD